MPVILNSATECVEYVYGILTYASNAVKYVIISSFKKGEECSSAPANCTRNHARRINEHCFNTTSSENVLSLVFTFGLELLEDALNKRVERDNGFHFSFLR